jgi:formylmethanofuran dehydrogenase subunit C
MALLFPISASIGQTYQTGSSNTYEWTGTYWKIKNVINFNAFSASIVDRVIAATNEQNVSGFAITGSNTFRGQQVVSGSILISGSFIPATPSGSFTSSFSLGSPTNAWKDIYVSQGSIIFVDAITQATSSFSITTDIAGEENTVQYSAAITASKYFGDGGGLYNLPSNTNWNKDKEYILRNTEQLTFSGDYILENAALLIEGSVPNSIGEWTTDIFTNGDTGSITQTSNNTFTLIGPSGNTNGSNGVQIKQLFETETTMSVSYIWNGTDVGEDRPYYDVSSQEPTEPNVASRLQNTNAVSESGNWIINVPARSWVAIGVWTDAVDATSGSLQITLPYLVVEDVQYSANKSFKREGTIFIGGNLLLKDSTIQNNGKISVGGDVILIGNSSIIGTGTII